MAGRIKAEDFQITYASMASELSDSQFTAASCVCVMVDHGDVYSTFRRYSVNEKIHREKERNVQRKYLKAEAKAHELLKLIIGIEQWRIYRKTNRVILKPGEQFWIIGDIFKNYNKHFPFRGKPDVIRIDNDKKLHVTSFCVDQLGGESTPYTDKIISFTSFLQNDKKKFIRTVNRIGEKTLKKIPECALWNGLSNDK